MEIEIDLSIKEIAPKEGWKCFEPIGEAKLSIKGKWEEIRALWEKLKPIFVEN